ncbi:MAG: type II methionyl aminopeptidase [Candidatus Micrarchaeota archaeon]
MEETSAGEKTAASRAEEVPWNVGGIEEEELKALQKASRISKRIIKFAREVADKEKSLLRMADLIEGKVKEEGGECAFPANLSLADEAAHYTPQADDPALAGEKGLLKVDLGVSVGGFCTDFAFTKDYSHENGKMVDAVEEALQNALSMMKAGTQTSAVGKEIERTIKGYGFTPIENLCGHSLGQYDLHAGVEIPNVETKGGYELQEGDVFAVEPFASTGEGRVAEGEYCQIYALAGEKTAVRLPRSRELVAKIAEDRLTLPFAARWYKDFPMLNLSLLDLVKNGALEEFPVLKEARKGALVSQAETCVIIEKDSVKVLV